MTEDQDFQARMAGIEALTRAVEKTADPALRASVKELMQSVMDLHGTAIHRMLELIHDSGPQGAAMIDKLGKDPLVGCLMILYGLHPLDAQARVAQAMDKLAPTFRKHDAKVELIGVDEGVVRLRTDGAPTGAAARALKSSIEEQIYALAPDVTRIEGLNLLGASDLIGIETLTAGLSHGVNGTVGAAAGKGRD